MHRVPAAETMNWCRLILQRVHQINPKGVNPCGHVPLIFSDVPTSPYCLHVSAQVTPDVYKWPMCTSARLPRVLVTLSPL